MTTPLQEYAIRKSSHSDPRNTSQQPRLIIRARNRFEPQNTPAGSARPSEHPISTPPPPPVPPSSTLASTTFESNSTPQPQNSSQLNSQQIPRNSQSIRDRLFQRSASHATSDPHVLARQNTIQVERTSSRPPHPRSRAENPPNSTSVAPEAPTSHSQSSVGGHDGRFETLIDLTRDLGVQIKELVEGLHKRKTRSQRDESSDSERESDSPPRKKIYKGPVRQKHLELKRRIRLTLARMEHRPIKKEKNQQTDEDNGFLPPLTDAELLNFKQFPLECGPTRENFRLCYNQPPKSDWNEAACKVILAVFFETYPDTKETRDVVAHKIYTHIRGRHRKYDLSIRDQAEKNACIVRNRRRGRRLDIYNRRLQALQTSIVLKRSFRQLLLRLGPEGMSSDETDGDTIRPQYLIHRRIERSTQLTTFLRDLDLLHIMRHHYDGAGNRKPGNFPNDRFESRLRSLSVPIPSLPKACYSQAWLSSLTNAQGAESATLEEVDLNVDYGAELTYQSLCLPVALQELRTERSLAFGSFDAPGNDETCNDVTFPTRHQSRRWKGEIAFESCIFLIIWKRLSYEYPFRNSYPFHVYVQGCPGETSELLEARRLAAALPLPLSPDELDICIHYNALPQHMNLEPQSLQSVGLWSTRVVPGQPRPLIIEQNLYLHITNVSLGLGCTDTTQLTFLSLEHVDLSTLEASEDGFTAETTQVYVCGLGKSASLTLLLSPSDEVVLSAHGPNTLFIAGYYSQASNGNSARQSSPPRNNAEPEYSHVAKASAANPSAKPPANPSTNPSTNPPVNPPVNPPRIDPGPGQPTIDPHKHRLPLQETPISTREHESAPLPLHLAAPSPPVVQVEGDTFARHIEILKHPTIFPVIPTALSPPATHFAPSHHTPPSADDLRFSRLQSLGAPTQSLPESDESQLHRSSDNGNSVDQIMVDVSSSRTSTYHTSPMPSKGHYTVHDHPSRLGDAMGSDPRLNVGKIDTRLSHAISLQVQSAPRIEANNRTEPLFSSLSQGASNAKVTTTFPLPERQARPNVQAHAEPPIDNYSRVPQLSHKLLSATPMTTAQWQPPSLTSHSRPMNVTLDQFMHELPPRQSPIMEAQSGFNTRMSKWSATW
ncbi:hypothetical protein SISSUDRAFT_1066895 [Sistotremastrum suecicum HHB10207 ss-3]|uniref:Nucleoplasmin-like domain-containing protein n=1 Tax=Sistotremastrum suecicum HHB10207 ss-3 TaxID=1314776 RepID=A0A165XRG1_9AGAM|nr:hypothetical protein SISSUDRAFT_1066895 [Sistotremastrum suecicum HHB10207 ss-3]